MNMTPKENFLACLRHETYDYIPSVRNDAVMVGFGAFNGPAFEKGPQGGGYDGFGVRWVAPESGGGAPIPAPGEFVLDSETVVDWKKIVKFPDLAHYDWETGAARELSIGDPNLQLVDFGSGNGPFERLAAMMGFEEALVSLAVEPEASFDFMSAVIDYKIDTLEYVKKYYNPDTFTNYDDIATQSSTFISPWAYREYIKPLHTRLNDAVKDYGIIPIQHTCGKADILIEDFIETGAAAWTSVQPTNDISGILQKYGREICLMGGYDSNGIPGQITASSEECVDEVRRCFDEYGSYPGFVLFVVKTLDTTDADVKRSIMAPINEASAELRKQVRINF